MATVRQFNRVWEDWTTKYILWAGLTDKAKAEIDPLWSAFTSEFQDRFGVNIQQSDSININQDAEFSGTILEKLKAWLECAGKFARVNYLAWCNLQ